MSIGANRDMHVFVISACEKRAWPKTRKVLDSYARRVGERAWSTPITLEGLGEMQALLKSQATRQTAIACYQNEGIQRMRLLWTIGSKSAFGEDGYMPVAYRHVSTRPVPAWLSDVSLLAQSGGYTHDGGKSGDDFQTMLGDATRRAAHIRREPVRHEWISYRLFQEVRQSGVERAWDALSSETKIKACTLQNGLKSREDAVDYLVVSHHKLLGKTDDPSLTIAGHLREQNPIPVAGLKPRAELSPEIFNKAIRQLNRVNTQYPQEAWQLLATLARASLILADHYVSSINYQETFGAAKSDLYANTKKNEQGVSRFDQPLEWHLNTVGDKAADIARNIALTEYDSLSQQTIDRIMEPSSHPRFRWQDQAVEFIKQRSPDGNRPGLILNTAGTGAGKTRGNAKLCCALSTHVRFAVALNLRSLTLQTGDSMKHDLGIMDSEMAVVIGDRVTEKLHQRMQDAFSIDGEDDTEIDVVATQQELPVWLKPLATHGKSTALIMPPVLVSTVDFLISASEPGRQGHHALALIRMINSDLILDELDSYEPKAFIAVLRLIQLSAMLGRNVICSSATLSVPLAVAVKDAYESGWRMHQALNPEAKRPLIAMIDDIQDPIEYLGTEDFSQWVKQRHNNLIEKLAKKPIYRMPRILPVPKKDEAAYINTIIRGVEVMHEDHKWQMPNGNSLSFGLIRIANIGNAMKVARALSQHYLACGKSIKIACYHANELRIQRFMKEKALDEILKRTPGWESRIANHPLVNECFTEGVTSIPFIVIATPVEEVGRDHDFDWGIIEPSSAQSIVQTCGRINRHRLRAVDKPNILILDCNFNALRVGEEKGLKKKPIFTRPGLETAGIFYSARKISEMTDIPLFDLENFKDQVDKGLESFIDRIDAGFRLGTTKMGEDEDRLISRQITEGMEILLKTRGNEGAWMSRYFYEKYSLRGTSRKERYRFAKSNGVFEFQLLANENKEFSWRRSELNEIKFVSNHWLSWDLDTLYDACIEYGIDPGAGMQLEISVYGNNEDKTIHWDHSFGFIKKK